MLSYDHLEAAVMRFLEESGQEFFDAEELAAELDPQAAGEERESVLRRVCGILDSCGLVARKHSSDLYYILENFFRGTEFLCKPREVELRKGILIPAARFEPFHPAELYPDELEISTRHSRDTFGLKEIRLNYSEISDLFLMLGPAGTMDMLIAESQDNYDGLRRMGGLRDALPVSLEAFDFSAFYESVNFRNGDLLRFRIESWSNGKLTVSHVPRVDSPTPAEVNSWIDKFETALTEVCRDYKDSLEIHEQLTYAYVYAAASGNDVRRIPGPSVDLYANMMQSISFRRDGAEWSLIANDMLEDSPSPAPAEHSSAGEHGSGCSCGHEHGNGPGTKNGEGAFGDLSAEDFSASQGTIESIEAILTEIHAPIQEIELQAYMMDTIANGAETFEEFARIHESLLKFVFTDEAQEAAYLNFVEELWEQTFEHYSHNMDSLRAPLRARLLELTDARIELSAAVLARRNATLPPNLREQMVKLHRDVLDTLFVLDRDAVIEEEDIENLELRVGDIEDDFELVSDQITRWLEEQISGSR